MPRSENQKLKLYYFATMMLEQTDEEHGLSMSQILEGLESYGICAERKSIYSDIQALEQTGIYIEKMGEGKNTKYHVIEREFESADIKILVDSIVASKFVSDKESQALIKKLKHRVSKYEAMELDRQIHLTGRVKTTSKGFKYSLDEIFRAISKNCQIQFHYEKWICGKQKVRTHDNKRYQVSPMAVTINNENYYLVAYDAVADVLKHYRIDKMVSVKCIDNAEREGLEIFKKIDIVKYSKESFSMYGGETTKVTLRVKKDVIGAVYDQLGTDMFEMPDKENDDCVIMNINVQISNQFFAWAFGIFDSHGNPGIEITGPDDAIEKMRNNLKAQSKLYK